MSSSWKLIEWLVLGVVIVLLLQPVFSQASFFTNDGPAHVYNSKMLKDMLFGHGEPYSEYFELNTRPEPNWLGHALLVLLMLVAKPLVAEKLLVTLYVLLFILGFRYVVSSFQTENRWAGLLAVPLVLSYPLYIGFYNFCLGLVVLLFTLGFWLRSDNDLGWKRGLGLSLLLLLGFFSHITTFLITVVCVTVFELYRIKGMDSKGLVGRWGILVALLLPTMALTMVFQLQHAGAEIPANTREVAEQWYDLVVMRPITVFHYYNEERVTKWFFPIVLATFYMVLLIGLLHLDRSENGWSVRWRRYLGLFDRRHGFLLLAGIFLFGYFQLPDWMASGGYVHVRLLLLFYLMIFLWIGTAKIPAWVTLPMALVGIITTHYLLQEQKPFREQQNAMVHEMMEVVPHIPEWKTVLPIIENHHWFFSHASNYLGAFKPLILLDNYEGDTGYFPLIWKASPSSSDYLGFPISNACGERVREMEQGGIPVEVIVHYADGTKEFGTDCAYTIEQFEADEFELTYTTGSGLTKVYLRKKGLNPTSAQP